jgi:SsrA-binding protein
MEIIATNRKATFNYHIFETYEAGIELKGMEVKSIRNHKVNISESFGRVENNEIFLYNMNVSPYEYSGGFRVDPLRKRKLLLHRDEIDKIIGKVSQKGFTIIPTKVYLKNGFVKVEIAIAKGKKTHDKRESIKKREIERRIKRYL